MELNTLAELCKKNNIPYKPFEPMRFHTSFKIGGAADIFITPETKEQLVSVLSCCKECGIPVFIIGNGSNLLVSDSGIDGAVISLSKMNTISVNGCEITCLAGAVLSAVCRAALSSSLTGAEFAYGIPGTAGGALYMNAGAYGGEMAGIIKDADYVTKNGSSGTLSAKDMRLGYRTSVFKNSDMIITRLTLTLKKGDKAEIEEKMKELARKRREKQPLEYPSAGSTFKRPEGYFAGTLIEKNGLKGTAVGGAAVSEKHAGFIINTGSATCGDVTALIKQVQQTVLKGDGVLLEPEVIQIGRSDS